MKFPTSAILMASLLAVSGNAETTVSDIDALCLTSIVMDKPYDEIHPYLIYNNLHESETGSDAQRRIYNNSYGETVIIYRNSLQGNMTPTHVEILTNASESEIAEKLSLCGFSKAEGNGKHKRRGETSYEKRTKYHPSRIVCSVSKGSPAKVSFTRIKGGI